MGDIKKLKEIAKLIRYLILTSTTTAASGHASSSLSATDVMTVLFFGGFYKTDLKNPANINNDRLIFSKGHASPLFYALYAACGEVTEEEMLTLRKFGSRLEGHPTMDFPFTEVATGSLGQGLSVGVGIALSAKYLKKIPYKTYVLLGDSEFAEGSNWEAIQLAKHYNLDNLIAILDVNRLGQRGETLYGHRIKEYVSRIKSFGWEVISINGHDFPQIIKAFKKAQTVKQKPVMIIAKTTKGKGVSLLEDQDGWHGVALKPDQLTESLKELGSVDKTISGKVSKPISIKLKSLKVKPIAALNYEPNTPVSTRKAYGNALVRIYPGFPEIVALDAETSNSTYSADFGKMYPERFFEMFIAEQNMVGVALGLSTRGHIPFVSTFGAFFSRAFDQIRMGQYSNSNVKFIGSHAGVSIGEDGASQMALEDIAMFRSILGSLVLYPSDAVSMEKLAEQAAKTFGITYIRTTRNATPILYKNSEDFPIGGSKTLRSSKKDAVTVIAAGITLYEALKAYDQLKMENIFVRVIDLYSIKPIDLRTLKKAAKETKAIITVEDHHEEGGIGETVMSALSQTGVKVYSLAVRKIPRSGKPDELLKYEDISSEAIVSKVKEIV